MKISIDLDGIYGDDDKTLSTLIRDAIWNEVHSAVRREVQVVVKANKDKIRSVVNKMLSNMTPEEVLAKLKKS